MTELSATSAPSDMGIEVRVVRRSMHIAASVARVWEYLTSARLLSQWLADVSGTECLVSGASFRFDISDGDFFVGRVVDAQQPWRLAIDWRFMGVGPRYSIEFGLETVAGGSLVVVTDRGALTPEEAEGLDEGWSDFLGRLARATERGTRERYEWNEQVSAAALLATAPREIVELLATQSWWVTERPPWRCTVHRTAGDAVVIVFHGDSEATEATVRATALGDRTYLHVSHVGWERLPTAIRVAERRRAATWWATVLARLEHGRG